ncbi:hypothetical protein [Pseudomonas sp. TMW 2.1634]|uniref:hypothetical protein n=1 Tax=Pseudomonas sp. TMW 2.1634 TaxID=1886807 RepID=UPI002115B88F|nr:hypothetical protein [Pseudomonas sp. TMW 2.1634]
MFDLSLYSNLKTARTEEDVKDAYIKALGLKSYTKGLIDIQTKEMWFEAKDTGKNSCYAMFTQLLHYVQVAVDKGETVPPFLAVIDTEKAALMKLSDVLPFLKKKTVKWGKSASQYTQEALDEISAHIGTHFVAFKISTHEEEFISTAKEAIKSGDIIRIQITPDNLKQVFDKWVVMIGEELSGVKAEDYALLFFADIMHDGTISTHANLTAELLHKNGAPIFSLAGKYYDLGNQDGYREFWAIYHKPPKSEYRDYLLERRDSLIPINERSFKGAFYTPLHVVDKAYDKLSESLGKNWQKDYVVWDMCCGVGNLEVKHSNHRNIFMSTLDQADIDVMKATKTCAAAIKFQYDYLNDDITDSGGIDYSLTNKVPPQLRKAISEGKKLLVLINPPYGETGAGVGQGNKNKIGVEKTRINASMTTEGYASKELFVQFLTRISKELPNATLAMFSTLKYVNAPNFEKFRNNWNAEYLGGFVVHSKAFDGIKGDFPIGFLVWKTNQNAAQKTPIVELDVDVLDKKGNQVGAKKYYNLSNNLHLNVWIKKPKTNKNPALPLSNAVTVSKNPRKKTSCDEMVGYLYASNNDLQHAAIETCITSSIYTGGNGGGLYIVEDNLLQVAVVFAMRRIVKPTWLNDRDQFLQPTEFLTDEFKYDCLIWMLFNGYNLTAGADDIDWDGMKWSLINHFIPFSEQEVGSPGRFESDFMVQFLDGKTLSSEAVAVLDCGREIWKSYFSYVDIRAVREAYKLNRPDVGWYQVRKALRERAKSSHNVPVSFASFESSYKELSEKLRMNVYELGFLRK